MLKQSTINDVCRSERFEELGMLERCSGDDGRESIKLHKLEEWVVDVKGEFLFRQVILQQLTILANGTGSAEDNNRVSSVLPSPSGVTGGTSPMPLGLLLYKPT